MGVIDILGWMLIGTMVLLIVVIIACVCDEIRIAKKASRRHIEMERRVKSGQDRFDRTRRGWSR